MNTEFIKSLNSNYERIRLEKAPDEKRYQYCILSRGGIRGLLPCSLRYINKDAYLYYDITSKQNVYQLFNKRKIGRQWIKDFVWSLREIRLELDRFLLNGDNVLWFPEQIFQDLENNVFHYLYVPYFDESTGFDKLLDFIIEKMDYEDEGLVECVYKMYEKYEENGEVYLQGSIFEDVKMLDESVVQEEKHGEEGYFEAGYDEEEIEEPHTEEKLKRNIFSIFESRKNKTAGKSAKYGKALNIEMEALAVAEETPYEEVQCDEEYGRTLYIEEHKDETPKERHLYNLEGRKLFSLSTDECLIGKSKEDADLVIDDRSISRIHARIAREGDDYFLEDMNSTNGTFKNGLRLEPYEKRKLQKDDEIKLGRVIIVFG